MKFDFNTFIDQNLEIKSVFPLIVIIFLLAVITVLSKQIQVMVVSAAGTFLLAFFILRHFTMKNDERVEKIFSELKKKGAIDREREIKFDRRVPALFRSGLFFYNTIFYNENGRTLDEDSIRFSLLHEEGHAVNTQFVIPPLIVTVSLILVPVCFLLLAQHELAAGGLFTVLLWDATILCFSLLFVIVMINNLTEPLRYDEYRSDEYAAKMLKEKFNVYHPSKIADNTFRAIRKQGEKTRENPDSVKNRLLYAFIRYHPQDEDRVKNIHEKFDTR